MFEYVNRGGKWRPGFEVVKQAILRCIPEATDLWFDGDRAGIIPATKHEGSHPFSNLSAGQKMMVALVADIAIKAEPGMPTCCHRTSWERRISHGRDYSAKHRHALVKCCSTCPRELPRLAV